MQVSKQLAVRNRILRALPEEEFARMVPHLESVLLDKDRIVYLSGDDIQYVYLPENGLLSLISTTENGSTMEVAMVGNEGVVGLPVILKNRVIPYEVTVRFTTEAVRIKANVFQEEFEKGNTLHEFVLHYINLMIAQISQRSICNRFHTLEQTLSRWLLTVHDHTNAHTLNLTQQVISHALGVPRTGVTVAAGALQRGGAIRYSRGKIAILDRSLLEASSCECYRIIRDELRQFNDE